MLIFCKDFILSYVIDSFNLVHYLNQSLLNNIRLYNSSLGCLIRDCN